MVLTINEAMLDANPREQFNAKQPNQMDLVWQRWSGKKRGHWGVGVKTYFRVLPSPPPSPFPKQDETLEGSLMVQLDVFSTAHTCDASLRHRKRYDG